MPKRSYSDEEKANALLALQANGGNVSQTAREMGIPRETLDVWSKGRVHPGVLNIQQDKCLPLADQIEEVVRLIVAALPAKVEGANLRDAALAGAILTDKMRLLREQPTDITRAEEPTDAGRVEGLAALYERLGQGGTRPPAGPHPSPPAVH